MTLEFGIDTFGDVTWDAQNRDLSHAEVIRNVVKEGVLADEVGLDVFALANITATISPSPPLPPCWPPSPRAPRGSN